MASSNLTIAGLAKRYGSVVALAATDLEVAAGEFLTLLGPSGSGKTTLLSLIAGLAQPDSGRLLIGTDDVTTVPPYERDIGMVFQNYALFPHMSVAENIAFPLKMRKLDSASAHRRTMEALEMVRLPDVAQRLPRELSGGQQQRIALARCLVYRPAVILMDEPLGALDKKLRDQMQLEIKRIHRELGTTIIYVTHDQEEAMTMSDRICLMNGGRIEQLGTPSALYFRPHTLFVADFLGESNLFDAVITTVAADQLIVTLASARASAPAIGSVAGLAVGDRVTLMVRPQNLELSRDAGAAGYFGATLADIVITGGLTKLYLDSGVAGVAMIVSAQPTRSAAVPHKVGDHVRLHWAADDAVAIRP